ncbi:diguanylate cyclase [uncultured Agrobacterium sp.]|uniref:sensor domain-containing diguanylate cyclase n=1 Tax=uncultured Agrobacterium sp. TaxID=157277 RepID=UPI0025D2B358|nr:diguanylate cyclase [uncultured Agrobacterium sp.]
MKKRSRLRLAVVLAVGAVFACLGIWAEYTNWQRLLQSANTRQMETARAMALHTDDILALAQQPLNNLSAHARDALGDEAKMQHLLEEMLRVVKTSPLLRSLAYADAQGRLIGSTFAANSAGMDLSDREYFLFHKSNASTQPRFGLPSQSQTNGRWFLPISQRIDNPDGSLAGIMIATIDMDHFSRFIETFEVNEENAFALLRKDGAILLRLPIDLKAMGANVADSTLYRDQIMKKLRGNYEYVSRFDGTKRISGFYRSTDTGVTAIATQTKASIFDDWLKQSKYPWLSIILAYLIGTAMAIRWIRQIELREIGDQKVAAREAEFRLIANASPDVIEKISLAGVRQYVSPAAARIFERDTESVIGTSVLDDRDDQTKSAWQDALAKVQSGSSTECILYRHQRMDGTMIWLESVISCFRSDDNNEPDGIVVITRDVTRQQMMKQELNALATTDELTRLFNKRYFNTQLSSTLAAARANQQSVSLILLDLDRFKAYNDTYGHLAGDCALRDVAAVIPPQLIGTGGLAARYGGEELVVLLPNTDAEETMKIAENIRKAIAALKIEHAGNLPWGHVTVSSGHATALPSQALSENDLITQADRALYAAKAAGRNRSQDDEENNKPEHMRSSI